MNKLLRLAVTIALMTWIGCRIDWTKVGGAFARLRLEYWLAAVAILLAAQVVSSMRWQYFARMLNFSSSLGQLVRYYFIGMYFNQVLPTSVGGDVVRAWYLDGGSGRRLAAFASVFLDRVNGLMVLVAMACVAVTVAQYVLGLDLPMWVPVSVWGVAGCGVLGVAMLAVVARLGKLNPTRREQFRTLMRMFRHRRLLATTAALSLVVQVASVLIVSLAGRAIDAPIPFGYYWVLVPMVSILTLLPSIGGWGVRETGMALFLGPLHVSEDTAITLSILWFTVTAACSVVGGVVYMVGASSKPELSKPEISANVPGEVNRESLDRDSAEGRARQHRQAA